MQAAREAARRAQCRNNLKQIGLAVQSHIDANKLFSHRRLGRLLGGRARHGLQPQPARRLDFQHPSLHGIRLAAQSRLGHDRDRQEHGLQSSATPRRSRVFNCPSRRAADRLSQRPDFHHLSTAIIAPVMARTDYAACCGDGGRERRAAGPSSDAPWPESDLLGPGNRYIASATYTGVIFLHSKIKLNEIVDGTSRTYLVGEKYLNPDNYYNGNATTPTTGACTRAFRTTSSARRPLRPFTTGGDTTTAFVRQRPRHGLPFRVLRRLGPLDQLRHRRRDPSASGQPPRPANRGHEQDRLS